MPHPPTSYLKGQLRDARSSQQCFGHGAFLQHVHALTAAGQPSQPRQIGKPKAKRQRLAPTAAASSQPPQTLLPHELIKSQAESSDGAYELRLYQPRFVVEMAYKSREKAYMAFDKYLTGENSERVSLEAPAPIVMRHDPASGTKHMQMFVLRLSSKLDAAALMEQPPFPNDDRLSITIAGAEVIASIRFPGQVTQQVASEMAARLKQHLDSDKLRLATAEGEGCFRIAQYDPVHSLSERTNELWLAVQM